MPKNNKKQSPSNQQSIKKHFNLKLKTNPNKSPKFRNPKIKTRKKYQNLELKRQASEKMLPF